MKIIEPCSFHSLDFKQRVQLVTVCYVSRCTTGKKDKAMFFKLYNHFKKQTPEQLQVLYDYLSTLPRGTEISLSDVYKNAHQFQEDQKFKNKKSVECYQEYSIDMLE